MTVTGSREALKPCPFCGRTPGMAFLCDDDDCQDVISAWVDCACGIKSSERRTEAEAVDLWNTRASPDPAGVTLTLEEIARLFAEHVRLVPVDPDGYARHAEYIDNIDDDLCWKVKPESKDAFATAILSLIQKPATSGTAAPVCELGGGE